MVMDASATAHDIWSRIAGLYRDNAETRSIYLEQEFHGLMQGSMSVADYCRKQKTLADELAAVGTSIPDRRLVLNTLRGLNRRFAHMRTLLSMQRPTPSFLETRSALILEELTLNSDSNPPTAFLANSGGSSDGNKTSGGSGGASSQATDGNQVRNTSNRSNSGGSSNNRRRNSNRSNSGGGSFNNGGVCNQQSSAGTSTQGAAQWLSF